MSDINDTKDTAGMQPDQEAKPALSADEQMIQDGFNALLQDYLNSNHRRKVERITKAFNFANQAHAGVKRRSGEPYIMHPIAVARIVCREMGLGSTSICSALLHDVVEDTEYTVEDIKDMFGEKIAQIVDGLTKISGGIFGEQASAQAENFRKLLLTMSDDIRVILIKIADRLHNMRTLQYMRPEKQQEKARETMDIYAPIAMRLGISKIKVELDDLSLKYLKPDVYYDLVEKVALRKSAREEFVNSIVKQVKQHMEDSNIRAQVDGRVKHFFSIYKKMVNQDKTIDQIYDLFAIRILVDTIPDCYAVLGIIHEKYKPIPGRFKDYIAMPKQNMYQSLHTTVISKEGIPFEVQIRTWEMHHTAEYGIAAHWKYKLGMTSGNEKPDSLEGRLQWIRNMLDNQSESEDITDLVRSIKTDLAPEEVFVFTPKGDVINLPMGSTVIDFAYAIHSAVGNRMIGAKVDQKIVPLDYKVKTGEIIEILTTKEVGRGPNRDWLSIVRTSEARNKIRAWFKKEKRDENIVEGKAELEREFKRNGIVMSDELMQFMLESAGRRHSCVTPDDFYAAVGYGGIQLWKLLPRVKEEYQKTHKPASEPQQEIAQQTPPPNLNKKAAGGVLVEGMDNCLIKFSRCCNPLPGDEIVGFITRGFGVSIHKRSCSNVPKDFSQAPEPERWVRAHWAGEVKEEFKSTLHIVATDRSGLLADVTQQLFNMHIFIHSLNSREIKNSENAVISATITINGLSHLQTVIDRLQKIKGVISIDRS